MGKQFINLPHVHNYPYSQAVKIGDCVYISGQIGVQDPETGEELTGFEEQCQQCLENFKKILELAGASLKDLVKVNVFLRNVEDYNAMNEVFRRYFPSYQPARSTMVSVLVKPNILVEIDGIAYCSSN